MSRSLSLIGLVVALTGCRGDADVVRIDGSAGVAPLVRALARGYDSTARTIVVGSGLGSRNGLDSVQQGAIDIAMASHGLDAVRRAEAQVAIEAVPCLRGMQYGDGIVMHAQADAMAAKPGAPGLTSVCYVRQSNGRTRAIAIDSVKPATARDVGSYPMARRAFLVTRTTASAAAAKFFAICRFVRCEPCGAGAWASAQRCSAMVSLARNEDENCPPPVRSVVSGVCRSGVC